MGVAFLMFVLLVVPAGGAAVQQLWNWLMPALFGLRPVTFWQAVGLLALSWILFGGFGWLGGGRRRRHGGWIGSLTSEERAVLLDAVKRRVADRAAEPPRA